MDKAVKGEAQGLHGMYQVEGGPCLLECLLRSQALILQPSCLVPWAPI